MGYGIAWMIGGTAGEGLETAGELFARLLAAQGYRPTTQRDFPSRIRGGDTTSTVRITPTGHLAPARHVDVALAFNDTVLGRMRARLHGDSILLVDDAVSDQAGAVALPFGALAKEAGLPRAKNMVALGASAWLLGLDPDALADRVAARFGGPASVTGQANRNAVQAGYRHAARHLDASMRRPLGPPGASTWSWMSGNEAAALGALAAGCRVAAAYPITPASDILELLTPRLAELGGIAAQMEDEMAALQVCIGAGFAGVRALTATSGPGLSLMTESVGLAGSAEVPCVIVDCQRPGPSTGMPTKHAQEDLWHMVHGGHGEFVRAVLAPTDVADAFRVTSEAFRIAFAHRCPVYVALDQQCSLFRQAVPAPDMLAEARRHGVDGGPESEAGANAWDGTYLPYADARPAVPGEAGGRHYANSTEHGPDGFTTEDPRIRDAMVARRRRKADDIMADVPDGVLVEGDADPDVCVVSWGSTVEACREAAARQAEVGRRIRVVAVRLLWPFPAQAMADAVGALPIVVVEANGTGQLARLIRSELPVHARLRSILRDDGSPVDSDQVLEAVA